jgi:hypothetical protein
MKPLNVTGSKKLPLNTSANRRAALNVATDTDSPSTPTSQYLPPDYVIRKRLLLVDLINTMESVRNALGKGVNETITLNEVRTVFSGKNISENALSVELFSRLVEKPFLDVISSSEFNTTEVGKSLSDISSTNEVTVVAFVKVYNDITMILEAFSNMSGKMLDESNNVSEAFTKISNSSREFMDLQSVTIEMMSLLLYFERNFSEIVYNTDVVALSSGKFCSDIAATTDTLLNAFSKLLSETTTSIDVLSMLCNFSRSYEETVNQVEVISQLSEKILNESSTISEAFSSMQNYPRSFSENQSSIETSSNSTIKLLIEPQTSSEVYLSTLTKQILETSSSTDTITIYSQGYFSEDYASGTYTGTLRNI